MMNDNLKKAFAEFIRLKPMRHSQEQEIIVQIADKHGVNQKELKALINRRPIIRR